MYSPMYCSKCYRQGVENNFAQRAIEFLRYVMTNEVGGTNMKNVKAIQEGNWPLTQKGLRSLVGLAKGGAIM